MKNVLIVCLVPDGGAVPLTLGIVDGFKQNNYDVDLVISDKIEKKEEFEQILSNDHIYHVDTHRGIKEYFNKRIKFKKKIKKSFLWKKSYDIVIFSMYHSWNFLVSNAVISRHKLHIIHDPILHSGSGWFKTKKITYYYKKVEQAIVLTNSFVELTKKLYKYKKVYYMPHGRLEVKRSENAKSVMSDDCTINYLFFGFIEKYKGLHVLAKAYKIVKKQCPNASLTVAGNGDFTEYKEEFEALENVLIHNRYIQDEDIEKYFNGKNIVLVLPYLDATQSGVISLAREFSIPVVATKTGGLMEQLDDGKIGLFAEPSNEIDLADKMIEYYNHREIYDKQHALMEQSLEKFNWDNIILELIKEVESN